MTHSKVMFFVRNSHEYNLQQSFTVERGKANFISFRFLIFETQVNEILSLPATAC